MKNQILPSWSQGLEEINFKQKSRFSHKFEVSEEILEWRKKFEQNAIGCPP